MKFCILNSLEININLKTLQPLIVTIFKYFKNLFMYDKDKSHFDSYYYGFQVPEFPPYNEA